MAEKGCALCVVTTDLKGRKHHQRSCPEMSFPSGQRRDEPAGVTPPPRFDPSRADKVPATTESPLTVELGRIFAGGTEAMIARHLEEMRARSL